MTAPSTVESVFWPQLTGRAGDNSWKQCSPEALELKSEWAELIIPRAKPVLGLECSGVTHRQGD